MGGGRPFGLRVRLLVYVWRRGLGIRSLVKLKSSSKKDISIIDGKGVIISDQEKNCNHFNHFFVNIGLNIDKTIPNSKQNFREYLHQIKVSKSFFFNSHNT